MERQATIKDLVLAPFMGLAYALFLPTIGFVFTAWVILKKLGIVAGDFTMKAAMFGWRPSEAYLAGRKRKGKKVEKGK